MIGIRLHTQTRGMHITLMVFVSENAESTHAYSGILSMRGEEYQAFRDALVQGAERNVLKFEEVIEDAA